MSNKNKNIQDFLKPQNGKVKQGYFTPQNPEKYTLDQTPETLRTAFKKMGSGNWVQGVEELASYYQKLGYGEYQVDIELPSGEIATT